jgi:hypothetical protein
VNNVPGERENEITSRSDDGTARGSAVLSGRMGFVGVNPGTLCRADFRWSLPGQKMVPQIGSTTPGVQRRLEGHEFAAQPCLGQL